MMFRFPFAVLALALLCWACGEGDKAPADATSDTAAVTDTAGQDVPADTADTAVVQGKLKWAQYDLPGKARAIAPIPGKPGSYVLVGEAAGVWRLDGTALTDLKPTEVGAANLKAVWAASDTVLFAAGEAGALLQRDAKGWTLSGETPPSASFLGLAGTGPQDVWVVGMETVAYRYDGTAWASQDVSPTTGEGLGDKATLTCVTTRTSGDVWIGAAPGATSPGVALHLEGGKWTGYPLEEAPAGLWVTDPDPAMGGKPRVFVVGGTAKDYVAIHDGKGFVRQDKLQWQLGFTAVAGFGADVVWASALKGQLRRWDKGTWAIEEIKSPPGTKPSEAVQVGSVDLIGLAVHGAEERAVLSPNRLFRYGKQP